VDPIWFQDDTSVSLQREVTIDPPPLNSVLQSSSPLELPTTLPSSSSQREISSTTLNPRSGWNQGHRYETRFRQHFTALTAITDETSTTPFDESLYSAFISIQDSYPIHSSSDLNFLEHYACAAQSNLDVLHYGAML
jgi:hypothetical protein